MELSSGIVATASTQPPTAAAPARSSTDVPSIIAPAPWIVFTALGLGFAFDQMHVFKVLAHVTSAIRTPAGLVLFAAGAWCIFRANVIFHRVETPFQPWRPTRTIAANDIYACTRNPMYQGFILLGLGLAVLFRSDWAALLMIPAALLVHHGVVLREEAYLERRFGEAYRHYKDTVPRWGWPFALRIPALSKR
jgi:protein-S-isoprenylcysteine O-methyltransferase Ste14